MANSALHRTWSRALLVPSALLFRVRLQAGKLGSVGPHHMRQPVPILVIVAAFACSPKAATPTHPPVVRDQISEVRRDDPRSPWMRPNPKPSRWMLGCFRIRRPSALRFAVHEPSTVQLTSVPGRTFGAWQLYEVWAGGSRLNLSSWTPLNASEIRVNLGTGFQGCEYKLQRGDQVLVGIGRRWSDVPDQTPPELSASFTRIPCGVWPN